MAEEHPRKRPEGTDPDAPSLELPSLGFGRKRRAKRGNATPAPLKPEPATSRRRTPVVADETPTTQTAPTAPTAPAPTRTGRPGPSLPRLGAVPAALVTGFLVGVITVGLVWASQRLCEVLRGTSSCGNAGFLLLLAILVVAGLLGGSLLKAFGVDEGGSTSFLAMGLVAVVLMLVLGDQLFAWWMVLAVPGVAMLSYVLAHRVTTAMVEPGGPELRR